MRTSVLLVYPWLSVHNRMHITLKGENRFEDDATRYAAYLETPEGRLRADLTFAELQDFLLAKPTGKTLRALDLGCGTGAAGVRLARLGMHVTLLDSSSAMLDSTATRACPSEYGHGTIRYAKPCCWPHPTRWWPVRPWKGSCIAPMYSTRLATTSPRPPAT